MVYRGHPNSHSLPIEPIASISASLELVVWIGLDWDLNGKGPWFFCSTTKKPFCSTWDTQRKRYLGFPRPLNQTADSAPFQTADPFFRNRGAAPLSPVSPGHPPCPERQAGAGSQGSRGGGGRELRSFRMGWLKVLWMAAKSVRT